VEVKVEIPHKIFYFDSDKKTIESDIEQLSFSKSFIGKEVKRVMEANKMAQTGYGTPVLIETGEGEENMIEETVKNRSRAGLTRGQYAAKKQKLGLYAAQEAKRAPKIQIDQKALLTTWIIGILVAFISSAIVSFNGITAVAEFVGLSANWMSSLFFFFVELMYLLFLVAYLILASRVDENGKPEKVWGAVFGMIGFAAIAVAANAFHTFDYWQWDWAEPRMYAGVILAVSAPIAIISASKMASRVVFAKAISL
jgi:hypothetical protein